MINKGSYYQQKRNVLMNNLNITPPNRRIFITAVGAIGTVSLLSSCGKSQDDTSSVPQSKPSAEPAPSDNGGNENIPQPIDKIDYSQNEKFGIVLGNQVFNDEYGEYR